MKQEDIARRLREELSAVQVSPALRRRTIDAAQGKEPQYMRRKLLSALVFALAAVLLCAAALAAAGRWGILDFAGRYPDSYIPEDAHDYVQTNVLVMENEWVTVNIREMYYDGRVSRMTADVTPKAEHVLLMGEDTCMEDPFINLTHEYVVDGDNDMRSVCQVIADEGYTDAYVVNVSIIGQEDVVTGSMDYILGEDGTLTIYSQREYAKDLAEREAKIHAIIMPVEKPFTLESPCSYEERRELEETITLHASAYPADGAKDGGPENVYVSTEPVLYESVGVRVDRLLLEVKPQEIHATVDYTIVDREKYALTDGGLWFEFVDPDSTAEAYYDQRLKAGLTGGGNVGTVDGDFETATKFTQRETLARNELHETYTLRAFDAWEKQRYETHTLSVRPAEKADLSGETE